MTKPYTNTPLAFEPLGILLMPRAKYPGLYIRETDGTLTKAATFSSEAEAQRVAEILEQKTTKTQAARDVMVERQRQIEQEGWTPDHDDQHREGELALAASCYAEASLFRRGPRTPLSDLHTSGLWPWALESWKPTDARRDLVKAAALILAEIERLDRKGSR